MRSIALTVALASLASASKQKPLGSNNYQLSNFIQSSIYSQNLDLSSLPEPVTLPPSFQYREQDENLFGGVNTFSHLDFTECTKSENSGSFDIGIVGHPFDLGVSYRPGARFGPNGARQGARRFSPAASYEYVTRGTLVCEE